MAAQTSAPATVPVRLLFIDDDEGLQALLTEYFVKKGIDVVSALNGASGLALLETESVDLVVLDLMMPEMDGFETLKALRKHSDLPVIMLTALEDETDRIVGLEMGADDYLHKPINPRELLARIKAILRRTQSDGNRDKNRTCQEDGGRCESPVPAAGPPGVSDVVLDMERAEVRVGGRPVALTRVEFDILGILVGAKGRIVSRDRLMDLARGRDFEAYDRSIDVHISRIRKKIETDPANPQRIRTVWGKGYKWDPSPS